jgi:hypothetical protein
MKISIEKFQELYNISQIEGTEGEKSTLLVQCLTGKSEEDVNKMNDEKKKKLVNDINKAFQEFNAKSEQGKPKSIIRMNGSWYRLNYDLAKPPMNAGKYVELATFSQDIIANMHLILATMCTPVRLTINGFIDRNIELNHNKMANQFLQFDFAAGYQSCVFFYAVFSKSIQNSPIYFRSISTNQNQMETILTNLQEVMDGYIMRKWLANLRISA